MKSIRAIAVVVCLISLLIAPAFTHAANTPRFELTVGGAFLRAHPSLISPLSAPVFSDTPYAVVARTEGNIWLKLESAEGVGGWILTSLGKAHGDLSSAPLAAPPAPPAPPKSAARAKLSSVITPITPKVKKLYRDSVKAGRSPNLFTVIGDCNSEPDAYLWRLAAGTFDASKYPELHAVIEQFSWSFTRGSLAARGGFTAASMFDEAWADPRVCQPGEGPLACELRLSNASVAFIALGTGDTFQWQDFEASYRRIVSATLVAKVVPVLVTKADDLESQEGNAPPGFINDVVRRLGREYSVPVIDFWAATRNLPDYGMRWEGNENFHMRPEGSDTRMLLTLQALDAIVR